jgi:phage regulator Rha-like protein
MGIAEIRRHFFGSNVFASGYDLEVAFCNLKMKPNKSAKLLPMPKARAIAISGLESRILFLRRQKVILDIDLARLYGVPVKRLNQQVNRNRDKFPSDFVFRLTSKELANLRLHFATSSSRHGGRRYLPYAFTEHGAIMVATVLNSKQAIQMSVFVVRAFVRLREILAANRELAGKIDELEHRVRAHDADLHEIFAVIRQLIAPKERSRRKIGFQLPAALPGTGG